LITALFVLLQRD